MTTKPRADRELHVVSSGLLGVVARLLLADKPLGFAALLGMLALTGIIARNSVILIDQIEKEMLHGRQPWEAVVEANCTLMSHPGGRRPREKRNRS